MTSSPPGDDALVLYSSPPVVVDRPEVEWLYGAMIQGGVSEGLIRWVVCMACGNFRPLAPLSNPGKCQRNLSKRPTEDTINYCGGDSYGVVRGWGVVTDISDALWAALRIGGVEGLISMIQGKQLGLRDVWSGRT